MSDGWVNKLYYGDNLDVLRERIAPESVDLIYLDPPFNSNRSYNVLFGHQDEPAANAQIQAFDDTWHWSPETEATYIALIGGGVPAKVADALEAMHGLVGEGDLMTYLVMMAPRIVQLHQSLKPTGSLYLHADPTASHYLKVLLDAIFGPEHFRNEIIWRRTGWHSPRKSADRRASPRGRERDAHSATGRAAGGGRQRVGPRGSPQLGATRRSETVDAVCPSWPTADALPVQLHAAGRTLALGWPPPSPSAQEGLHWEVRAQYSVTRTGPRHWRRVDGGSPSWQ